MEPRPLQADGEILNGRLVRPAVRQEDVESPVVHEQTPRLQHRRHNTVVEVWFWMTT